MADSTRLNFFRQAATEAARGARKVIPLVDPLIDLVGNKPAPATEGAPAAADRIQRTEPATPTSQSASVDEMLAIAAELDLGSRSEDLRRLAVSSVRLTVATDAGGPSFAGGEPVVPTAVEVPDFESGPARFVALLDLPRGGRLWIFRADPSAGDPGPTDAGDPAAPEVGAVLEPGGDPDPSEPLPRPPGATPLSASRELTLPRPWSTAVAPLVLSQAEQDSWQELRTRLATAQGVPLGESAPSHFPIHRIGGFPDERRGEMPLICELGLLGIELEGRAPATHPLAAALEDKVGTWRLLAQLATDDDLDWSWGPAHQRLYVWGHAEGSASDQCDSVTVVIQ